MQTFSLRFLLNFSPVFLISPAIFAQFKASTELVVVDALVESKKTGAAVRTLTKSDFEIYEDKVRQEISQFSVDKLPLSIVFLFDMTESVRPVLKPLGEGALGAMQHLKSEDEIAVMLYAGRANLAQGFTTDHTLVAHAIDSASTMTPGNCGKKPELCGQPAYFNEGIFTAATYAHKSARSSNRRVIIWLTDNVPNVPVEPEDRVHTEAAALGLLQESGVVVCALLEHSAMSYAFDAFYTKNPMFALRRKHHPPGDTGKYAEETGGVVLGAKREEISAKLADLIDRLRSRYTIGYRPSSPKPEGTLCKIDVRLTAEALKREGTADIRARRGYKR